MALAPQSPFLKARRTRLYPLLQSLPRPNQQSSVLYIFLRRRPLELGEFRNSFVAPSFFDQVPALLMSSYLEALRLAWFGDGWMLSILPMYLVRERQDCGDHRYRTGRLLVFVRRVELLWEYRYASIQAVW